MDEALKQAFLTHPVGMTWAMVALICVFFLGYALLINGWPKFGRRK